MPADKPTSLAAALAHVDPAGNLVLHIGHAAPGVHAPTMLFDAHMDEVGYQVTAIQADGDLVIRELGGFYGRAPLCATVSRPAAHFPLGDTRGARARGCGRLRRAGGRPRPRAGCRVRGRHVREQPVAARDPALQSDTRDIYALSRICTVLAKDW